MKLAKSTSSIRRQVENTGSRCWLDSLSMWADSLTSSALAG